MTSNGRHPPTDGHRTRVLVCGAGGFIGHHLTSYLVSRAIGCAARTSSCPTSRRPMPTSSCSWTYGAGKAHSQATADVDEVYQLAANMGGIGFIESHKAEIMHDSALINLHVLEAARINGANRFLFSSSACVYPGLSPGQRRCHAVARGRRVSGRCGGRLRLGEALHGASVPPLLRGLRTRDTCGSLSQHLWRAGHLRRRPREIASRHLPQGGAGRGWWHHRGLG